MDLIIKLYRCFIEKISPLYDVVLLLARVWIAKIFFFSGLTKINDWEGTLQLFEYEYAVPFLPVALAAYSATIFELVMPVLLVLGLFTRLAAIPLLVMTAVIEFTYGSYQEHIYWALLLGIFISYGAGKISIDHIVRKKYDDK